MMANWWVVLRYSLWLGLTGFGGPLAILARLQKDVVEREKWVAASKFQAAISVIKTLPGPVGAQAVIFVGREKAGTVGGFLAGIGFILPSFLMMLLIAYFYADFREIEALHPILRGLQAAAFLVIALSLYDLTKVFHGRSRFWGWFLFSLLLLIVVRVAEPIVILGVALLSTLFGVVGKRTLVSVPLELFLVAFVSAGLAFGTGLSILPLLEHSFVGKYQWLTHEQFLDAIAFGQLTPGPILISLTFMGFLVAGFAGAIAATVGGFFLSFVNMLTWFPELMTWLSRQRWMKDFLVGSIAAIAAGIVIILWNMGSNFTGVELVVPILIFTVTFRRLPVWGFMLVTAGIFWLFAQTPPTF